MRGCRNISDKGTREETLRFAREEFRRNKDVRDLVCLCLCLCEAVRFRGFTGRGMEMN